MAKAREWAYRCTLELQAHHSAAFTTLTYNEENVPLSLSREHLSAFLKRLRKQFPTGTIRFFGCGEYGEKTQRPHYHTILFGADERHRNVIEDTWGLGNTRTERITPRRIAYTAGYCSKKVGFRQDIEERIDYETGEVYEWQPPFIQMSRRPGLGAHAKKYVESWRSHAIYDGQRIPVPRFLHEAWKQQASEADKEDLLYEKSKLQIRKAKGGIVMPPLTPPTEATATKEERRLAARQKEAKANEYKQRAKETIARKQQSMQAERRKL